MKLYRISNYLKYTCKECLSQDSLYFYANSFPEALEKYKTGEGGLCGYCITDEIVEREKNVKSMSAKEFINDGFTESFKCSCGTETSNVYIVNRDKNNPMCEHCLTELYTNKSRIDEKKRNRL